MGFRASDTVGSEDQKGTPWKGDRGGEGDGDMREYHEWLDVMGVAVPEVQLAGGFGKQ